MRTEVEELQQRSVCLETTPYLTETQFSEA